MTIVNCVNFIIIVSLFQLESRLKSVQFFVMLPSCKTENDGLENAASRVLNLLIATSNISGISIKYRQLPMEILRTTSESSFVYNGCHKFLFHPSFKCRIFCSFLY